jgi:hypothetical protein
LQTRDIFASILRGEAAEFEGGKLMADINVDAMDLERDGGLEDKLRFVEGGRRLLL